MTDARIGHGAEFWLDDASDTLTQLDEMIGLDLPDFETEDVDATHFQSVGKVREFIAGLTDPGTGEISFNLVPGSDTDLLLQAAKDDGVARNFEAIIPNGAFGQKHAGQCIVKKYTRNTPLDGKMEATAMIRYTGAVTITTEAS